jgi:hypothetical protein
MERSKGEEEREGKVRDRELMRDKSKKERIEREKKRKGGGDQEETRKT